MELFCGETGSSIRYELPFMGPSMNKSTALIICDEEIRNGDNSSRTFCNIGIYPMKGYNDPVSFP